jgi:hypothetical protein
MSTAPLTPLAPREAGVFGPDEVDELDSWFRANGYVILRGLFSEAELDEMEAQCVTAQEQLVRGELDERHGTTILIEGDAGTKAEELANYVTYVNELSPAVDAQVHHPAIVSLMQRWLGADAWLLEHERFGAVYQDARPGRESSYTRIGWHSDWQSGPNLDIWPSVAYTFHVDATSPANGFLRVVPGSHLWWTPAPFRNANNSPVPEGSAEAGGHSETEPPFEMPLGFDKIPGEVAVYCDRGDIIFHDAYLWHSAARGTDDETRRRHIRGGWYSGGGRLDAEHLEDFVKNAAR